MRKLLQVENLSVALAQKSIVENLSFSLSAGEVVFLLGKSGAGKSVILKALLGLEDKTSGKVAFSFSDGSLETSDLDEVGWRRVRNKVGYVPQIPVFMDSLTIAENFYFFKKVKLKDLEDLFSRYGLPTNWLESYPSFLSFGALKQISCVQRLFLEPEILILDEPTTSLDYHSGSALSQFIKKITQEKQLASLVVSHDIHYALEVADRIFFLEKGHLICETTPQKIFSEKNPLVERFLECR